MTNLNSVLNSKHNLHSSSPTVNPEMIYLLSSPIPNLHLPTLVFIYIASRITTSLEPCRVYRGTIAKENSSLLWGESTFGHRWENRHVLFVITVRDGFCHFSFSRNRHDRLVRNLKIKTSQAKSHLKGLQIEII